MRLHIEHLTSLKHMITDFQRLQAQLDALTVRQEENQAEIRQQILTMKEEKEGAGQRASLSRAQVRYW